MTGAPDHNPTTPETNVTNLVRRLYRRYGICWRHHRIWRWACRRCQQVRYQ